MEAENGYEIFSIFHIATRDDDQRCVISDAPRAAQSPPSVFPPASPRARHKMDQLMRWLISLLSFVQAKYYTLKKGNYTNKNTMSVTTISSCAGSSADSASYRQGVRVLWMLR